MTDHQRTVFFLHGAGFSAASAAPLLAALGQRFRVVGIDLPGHGGAPDAANGSVDAMANVALATVETRADGGLWPARHSAAPVRPSCWLTPPLKYVFRRRRSIRSTEADRKRNGDSLKCQAPFSARVGDRFNVVQVAGIRTYQFRDQLERVTFTKRWLSMETALNSAAVVRAMVDRAQERGRTAMHLARTEDFKRQAGIAAEARGIEAVGHEPTQNDHPSALLTRRL